LEIIKSCTTFPEVLLQFSSEINVSFAKETHLDENSGGFSAFKLFAPKLRLNECQNLKHLLELHLSDGSAR